ncbi:MAG: CatA-like O-acetyltransferase [Clostridiales bacterium]|nr:CatA-like O-acetyltransferase [Clostridiales bacterium]
MAASFTYINEDTWPRKPYADFFARAGNPFFTVTFPLDVSETYAYAKRHGLSFYHLMIYLSTRAMNSMAAFRYKLRENGVVLWEYLSPSFTFMYNEAEDLFGIVNMDTIPGESPVAFCARAAAAQSACLAAGTPLPSLAEDARDDLIYYSSLPWLCYTEIAQELPGDKNDSIPRPIWGKFEERDGSKVLPYTVQINHRLLDGVHVYRLKQALEAQMADLKSRSPL